MPRLDDFWGRYVTRVLQYDRFLAACYKDNCRIERKSISVQQVMVCSARHWREEICKLRKRVKCHSIKYLKFTGWRYIKKPRN